MGSRGDEFKPIQAEFRLTAKAACNYTDRPEVTAAPAGASGGVPLKLAFLAHGEDSQVHTPLRAVPSRSDALSW
jgi:hypothetical protein